MNLFLKTFGWKTIYRPDDAIVAHVAADADAFLKQQFAPGIYTDSTQINSILKRQFQFYSERAKRLVKKLASRDFMEFLLYQYDLTTEVQNSKLNDEQGQVWKSVGPELRRALKYLAEQTVLRSPPTATVISRAKLQPTVEEAIQCAIEMVRLYHSSDWTYGLFPQHTELEIFAVRQNVPFSIRAVPPYAEANADFNDRVSRHAQNEKKFVPELAIDVDPQIQSSILDPYFERGFGVSYNDFCGILTHVIDDPLTLPTRYPIPFCHFETILKLIAQHGVSITMARRILSGFTLWRNSMLAEGREMWNVKQHHRAFRRPLFEFPHETGTHVVWSRGMARESFIALLWGAAYQKLPSEWLIPEIQQGLSELSNRTGLWFENLAIENLSQLNLKGTKYKTHIPAIGKLIEIPQEVGEIDFLGALSNENLLVIAEFKMVEMGAEPKFYRDDVSQFVTKKNSYSARFERKIHWLWQHRDALAKKFGLNPRSVRLAAVMLTMYPTFASTFIKSFPCVSLTELMLDYQQNSKWPYQTGILS